MGRGRKALGLAGWLLVVFASVLPGSQFPPGLWYERLEKPEWTPPDEVFGPVWTILYFLSAVAAWLVWERRGFDQAGVALSLFLVQLVLNALWPIFFFGLQSTGGALVDILLLWIVLAATVIVFFAERRVAGLLMTPYLAWVTFATALNYTIWIMNPLGR